MDNAQNFYVYNPLQQSKNIGRRTGKPIHKKRNIYNGSDNFDDYLTDSDVDESINVTKHIHLSGTEITEIAPSQQGTTSSAVNNNVTQSSESCFQKDVAVEGVHHMLPEKFGGVRVVNPLAIGSRIGRRTGKDILAGKTKILAGGMDNFSDYLTDSSDVSVSLQVTPRVSPAGISSPSTSAKESDGNFSPKKSKERPHVFNASSMQEIHKSVCTENSPSICSPQNEVDVGISFKGSEKNLSISTSLVSQNAPIRSFVHEPCVSDNIKIVEVVSSNEHAQNMTVPEVQLLTHVIEKMASNGPESEELQIQSIEEGSASVNNKSILNFDNGSNINNLNASELKKQHQNVKEQARVYLSRPKTVQSCPEKENVIPKSSLQAGKLSTTEEAQDRASDNNDGKSFADKRKAIVNQKTLQEESLKQRPCKERCVPVDVCVPEADDPVKIGSLMFDGDKTVQANCSVKIQHGNIELQRKINYTTGVSESPKLISDSQTKNSAQKTFPSVMSVHIPSVSGDIHAVEQSDQLIKADETINAESQSTTSGSLAKSQSTTSRSLSKSQSSSGSLTKTTTATLNFGGDIIGSVSNSEKAVSGQFFGIKKRLSYSSAMVDREQQNEKHKKSAEAKGTKQMIKSVGSFLEHHDKVHKDLPDTVSGTSTFITLAPRRVSQLITDEQQVEPLSSLNTSTDSSGDFHIVEEDIKEPNLPRISGRNSKTGTRKMRLTEEDKIFPAKQTKMRTRKKDSETDVHKSIKEQSVKQTDSLHEIHKRNERITELPKKRITESVTSFLEHHDKVHKDLPDTVSGTTTFITLAPRRVSQLITDEQQVEPHSSLNTSTDSSDDFHIVEEDIKEPNLPRVSGRNSKIARTRKMKLTEEDKIFPAKQTKMRTRKMDSEIDVHKSINEQSVKQTDSLHERIIELPKKRITESVTSFLEHHDKVHKDLQDTASGTTTFITLAPRRLPQQITDKQQVEPLSSLNTNTDSLDDLQLMEEEIKQPKLSNTNKRSKKREVNTGKRKMQHSEKDKRSPAKQMKRDKGERKIDKSVHDKQINNESVNHNSIKVSRHQKTNGKKLLKKVNAVVSGSMDKNEAVDYLNNINKLNTKQYSSLQEVHEESKKVNKKSNLPAKESKVGESINVKSVKNVKQSKKLPDLMESQQLNKSLVLDLEHCSSGVIEDNRSVPKSTRSRYSVQLVQYPFVKTAGKCEKLATKVKKAASNKMKNKSNRNKTSRARQTHNQVKKYKIRTRGNNQAHFKQEKLLNDSNVDKSDMNSTELENDSIGIISKNTLGNNVTEKVNAEKTYPGTGKSMYSEISGTERRKIKNVAKQIHEKTSIENSTDDQECVFKEVNNQQFSQIELKDNCSRIDFLDLPVPVKLSTGKKSVAAKKSASRRKRQSFKASAGKRKSALNREGHDESTPVKLRLISSLPNVTPQSGISFRRSRCFTSTFIDNAGLSPAAEPTSQTLRGKECCTPNRKQQEVPVLTSCLKSTDSLRLRRKLRRVRISSIIDQKEMSPVENQTSDGATDVTTTSLLSPSSSPVHYRETTTNNVYCKQKSPKITLPDLSYKIVRPEVNPVQGLRRSSRTKVRRLNTHKGEEIIYRRDSTGFGLVVDGIQPSIGEARVKAAEEERRRRLRQRKLKAMNVPAKPKKRLSTHWKMNNTITNSAEIPVVNPENNEEVHLELIARQNSATWYGPDLVPVMGTEPIALCLYLKQPMFTTGELHMRPLAEKPLELVASTLIFNMIYGKIHLTINNVSTIIETGDNFFIPRGTSYALKNLRRDIAKLHFVDVNDANKN